MQNEEGIPITVVRGTDFYLPILYITETEGYRYPVDITGYTAKMQIRQTVGSEGTPLAEISTDNGYIVIDGPSGKIELVMSKAITSAIPPGEWVYDCLVTNSNGWTEQIIFGIATVLERTTKVYVPETLNTDAYLEIVATPGKTVFTLDFTPTPLLYVAVNGVVQNAQDFSIVNNILTMNVGLSLNDKLYVFGVIS